MRISVAVVVLVECALLAGCVDPAHSRFANKGACEVSVGSHFCSNEDDSEGRALTANSDPSLHEFTGNNAPGGR